MVPGITFYSALQPFLIALGNIIMVLVLILSVAVAVAMVVYIARRELRWWRQEQEAIVVEPKGVPPGPLTRDRIVGDIALLYVSYDRLVLSNKSGARSVAIGRTYPDIVIKERVPAPEARREPAVLLVGEVETTEVATPLQVGKWRALSRLGAPFALFVLQDTLAEVERLIAQENLSVAQLWGYTYTNGRIQLVPGRASRADAASPLPTPAAVQPASLRASTIAS